MSSEENSRSLEEVTLVMETGGEVRDSEQNPKTSSLDEYRENIDNEGVGSPNNDKNKTESMKEGEPFVVVGSCDRQTSDTGGEEEGFSMLSDVNNEKSPMNVEEGLPGNRKDGDVISPNKQDLGQEQHECMDEGFTLVDKGDTDDGVENKTEEYCLIDSEVKKQDVNVVNNGHSPVWADAHVPSQESEENRDELHDALKSMDNTELENQTKTENPAGVNVDVKNSEENQSNPCQSMSCCTEDNTCSSIKTISEKIIVASDTEETDQKERCEKGLESERHSKNTEMTATDIEGKMPPQIGVEMLGCKKEISPMNIDETGENLNANTKGSNLETDTRTNYSMNEHSIETDENTDGGMLMGDSKATEANSGVDKSVSNTKTDTGKTELLHSASSNTVIETLNSTSKPGEPDITILPGDNGDSLENGEATTKKPYNESEGLVTLGEAGVIYYQRSSDQSAHGKPIGDLDTAVQGYTRETCEVDRPCVEKSNTTGSDEDRRAAALAKVKDSKTNDDDEYDYFKDKEKAMTTDVDASEVNFKDWDYFEEREKAMMKFVYFWKRGDVFSQWHRSKFYVDGQEFNCAEQYMMYKKAGLFGDEKMMKKIRYCKDPRKIKQYGRKVKHFEEDLWRAMCLDFVKDGNKEKFSQNPDLKKELVSTHPRVLVEASPLDAIWGIGLDKDDPEAFQEGTWKGLNLLGYILTEVRDEIMAEDRSIPEGNKKVYLEKLKRDYCLSGCSEQTTDRHAEPISKEDHGCKYAMEFTEGATGHTNIHRDGSTPPTTVDIDDINQNQKGRKGKKCKKNKNKFNLASSGNSNQDGGWFDKLFGKPKNSNTKQEDKANITYVTPTESSTVVREKADDAKQMQVEHSDDDTVPYIDETNLKENANIKSASCDKDVEKADAKTCTSDQPDTNRHTEETKLSEIVDKKPDMVTGNSSDKMSKQTNSEYENQVANNNSINSEVSDADETKNEKSNRHDTEPTACTNASNQLPEDQTTEPEIAETRTKTEDDRGDTPKPHNKADTLKGLFLHI